MIWISSNRERQGVEVSRLEVKGKKECVGGACINSRIRLSLGDGSMPELCGLELDQSRVREL